VRGGTPWEGHAVGYALRVGGGEGVGHAGQRDEGRDDESCASAQGSSVNRGWGGTCALRPTERGRRAGDVLWARLSLVWARMSCRLTCLLRACVFCAGWGAA
jgi:hypothetical protein